MKKEIIIEDVDFRMESVRPDCEITKGWFFDLYLLKTINEGKENERLELKWAGYGCTTPYCIELIADSRAERKFNFKSEKFQSIVNKEYNKNLEAYKQNNPDKDVSANALKILREKVENKLIRSVKEKYCAEESKNIKTFLENHPEHVRFDPFVFPEEVVIHKPAKKRKKPEKK